MALQSSGAISMGDMRTEFGISGAISMSDLYRGGSEVPSSATSNSGGTITKAALSGGGTIGVNGSYNTTTVEALPTTIAAGDTYATNSNITSFVNTQNGGGFSGAAAQIFFSNSSGTIVGSSLFYDVISSGNSFSGSRSTAVSLSGTVASNHVGATHFAYKVNGGGAQFQNEDSVAQSSLTQGSLTLVQNRTSDVNTGVPASSTIAFSDLYGATA
tara:strand:+ start:372 stop:1016 length:645 start_codon:yes stop_codon:yes gene_type:complete